MRIVHVITRLILGGAQENTLLTVEGLHHRFGDDVTLITGPAEGPEGDLFDRADRQGLKVELMPELVRPIRPATDLKAYRLLRRAFRRLRPEVVHTHSSKAGILARAAAWHERVPLVVHTIHGLPFGPSETPWRNRLYVGLERWAARRCHAIVSVCDAMTEQALAAGVGRPDQYETIFSGMEVEPFLHPPRPRDEVRRELGLPPEAVAFATVARLFERKGHDDLLDIAPRVLEANPRVRFVWIGSGLLREHLEARAEALGVRHAITFTGLVPPGRIPELLGACDVVLHPSYREGLARVLPQGLIVGRPAISYDVDGAREVVTPETGILVPFRDRQALAEAILALAGDEPRRRALGQEGRRRFSEQFRHEVMVDSIRSLYERRLGLLSPAAAPGDGRGGAAVR
ncbi:glycosyltransferase family 4 protein [Tautonia sociabilis]|uniref:Glycosyltransferase family 1 protein n=1 Tax=Tautonia sociabilis TaxID=2080755 RepID=A0A432MLM8_9BACT|nr:glycosyltransferase family 4 protein [Tautonia sociabilis]RUL88045.1 glycosyltransferase family 1 protein [Tautonia sociabilis]